MRSPILAEALSRKGAVKRVAEANGITPAAVCQWKRVPPARLAVTAAALGLRPDQLAETEQQQDAA